MQETQMFLDDANKSVVLGLPPAALSSEAAKLQNPFYNAVEYERNGNRQLAENIYLELLNQDFENPVVMAALGMNYAVIERNGLAHLLLSKALANLDGFLDAFKRLGITPKSNSVAQINEFIAIKRSEIQNAIGTCFKHENKIDKARYWFELAQSQIPLNPDIQNNLGTLFINEGKPQDSLPYLDAAINADPNHGQAHWNRSLAYLEMGDYARGWPEYDWGVTAKVRVDRQYTVQTAPVLPYWKGEPDANLVVYGEQGIGDEIMFASMLPDLLKLCPNVVFECHKKLHKLFANSFPGLHIYPTREDEKVTWPILANGTPRYPFTHRIALGSLGQFFRQSLEDFPGTPYLEPTPACELKWNERLAEMPVGPKIGISWIGGHKKTRIEVRSIDLEHLLPIFKAALARNPNTQFISLQYTPQEDEVEAFEKKHGIKIHQFPEAAYSAIYDDKAGLVANLDLVITVCTSVVHLAGALGVPTWVMVPSRPAWRYRLDLDVMPWYANTTLFRQPDTQNWKPVIEEVAFRLSDLLT